MDLWAGESNLVLCVNQEFAHPLAEFCSCSQCIGPELPLEQIPCESVRCEESCQRAVCMCKDSLATDHLCAQFAGTGSFHTPGLIWFEQPRAMFGALAAAPLPVPESRQTRAKDSR
eukprot:2588421-Amphidinium_carterae.1